jgi:hypothetical protein
LIEILADYGDLRVKDAVSLRLSGDANELVRELFSNDEWHETDTLFSFLDIEDDVAIGATEVEVRSPSGHAREYPWGWFSMPGYDDEPV